MGCRMCREDSTRHAKEATPCEAERTMLACVCQHGTFCDVYRMRRAGGGIGSCRPRGMDIVALMGLTMCTKPTNTRGGTHRVAAAPRNAGAATRATVAPTRCMGEGGQAMGESAAAGQARPAEASCRLGAAQASILLLRAALAAACWGSWGGDRARSGGAAKTNASFAASSDRALRSALGR